MKWKRKEHVGNTSCTSFLPVLLAGGGAISVCISLSDATPLDYLLPPTST